MQQQKISLEEFIDINENELTCIFAETGADRELDFDEEYQIEKLYDMGDYGCLIYSVSEKSAIDSLEHERERLRLWKQFDSTLKKICKLRDKASNHEREGIHRGYPHHKYRCIKGKSIYERIRNSKS